MQNRIISIALNHKNLMIVQRAKRVLRLRYNINLARRADVRDPVWLSAYSL